MCYRFVRRMTVKIIVIGYFPFPPNSNQNLPKELLVVKGKVHEGLVDQSLCEY